MSIAEVNNIFHKEHPLKLIENWETVLGGDDEKQGLICCNGCQEPIFGGYVYGCIPCHCFIHKTCAELEPTLNHHFHFQHPLILTALDPLYHWNCNTCDLKGFQGGFKYGCSLCDFDACIKCGIDAAALYKEANVKLEHEGHPQHTLTLQSRPAAFHCDACKTDDKDLFYQCNDCSFWIHKTCATLAPTIDLPNHDRHPLFLAYSLPKNFYDFRFCCEVCEKVILRSYWVYYCAKCRTFSHIKCALSAVKQHSSLRYSPSTSNGEEETNDDLLHFPMSEAFTDPLKLQNFKKIIGNCNDDYKIEINHWSHVHPLILNVEPQSNNMPEIGSNDPIKVCNGCVQPLSFPYYCCKEECSFTLHKYCAKLPRTLEHQLHPDHLLNLILFEDPMFMAYTCNGCLSCSNGFFYKCESCKFYLDVNCAFLPNTIKHECHKHPLVQIIDPKTLCKACGTLFKGIRYSCKACNYQLDMFCTMKTPRSVAHNFCEGHEVPLAYPPFEDHPQDFFCDICDLKIHPKTWLYYSKKFDSTFHIHCITRIALAPNLKLEGTISVSYHKHPLTYVRRRKTPRYVCFSCTLDINSYLILECQTETCPFRICVNCHFG